MEKLPVIVYGATGYTGRLVCRELQRRGGRFAIAGRDRGKLIALARETGEPEIVVAALDDPPALEKMAARARVVLDCAGPFVRWGRPVQDAALVAGSHFLDITGEAGYMLATAARHEEASARGVALVNAVGFDVVPTDAAAVLAAEAAGAPVERVRIAFVNRGGRATQGTIRSALTSAHQGGAAFVDGKIARERVGAQSFLARFPQPIGDRECLSIPWGDLATAPRSTRAREVRTFLALPPRASRFVPLVARAAPLTRFAPVQSLLERWVRTLPEGPSDEERARGRFAVYAEAEGANGTRSAWVTGGDGYDFTAAASVRCAERAADPTFAGRGALTPTQAFGARWLLESLAEAGVKFGLDAA